MPRELSFPEMDEILASSAEGVRVLVVDSGVEEHPALEGRSVPCWRIEAAGEGAKVVRDKSIDVFGHGTAVAAIIHQHAPGCEIDSLRVLGGDLRTTSHQVLAGLEWALSRDYDIINCSFGSPNDEFLPAYKRLVDDAFCRNIHLIAACSNVDFRRTDYPSSFPTVISTDFGKLSGLDVKRRLGRLVEFVARGEQIRVAWKGGGYRVNTGSSFAAPHLCALVARLRKMRPKWNACEIKSALYNLAPITRDER